MSYTYKYMSQDARRDEEQSTQRRAGVLGMSYVDVSTITKQLYKSVLPVSELVRYRVIPLQADDSHIHFGITTTTSQQTLNALRSQFSDQQISYSIISETGFNDYIQLYDPPKQVTYQDISVTEENENKQIIEAVSSTLAQVRSDDMLAYLVQQAYKLNASDIHLECQRENVRVRFRIDGVLHPVAYLPSDKYRQLISSLAVAANVSTNSKEPQTGHINKSHALATGEEVVVNLRVETVQSIYGMDVVMRLFTMQLEFFKLENLGLSEKERVAVEDVIKHPTGLVLIVGPTGSGKTTTLYSLLNTLNSPQKKIITLEDPVEYFLPGVVQIPVSGELQGKGFAETLRAVLRLDPDIVMVGEIRDPDTAKTSLQASLTGHLVMSTFHAGSAAAALTRMLDAIGINPLFSSAIHLVMAQRLVRKLDEATKVPYHPDEPLKQQLKSVLNTLTSGTTVPDLDQVTLYKPGTSADSPFGYKGQLALREQLTMTPGVRELLRLPPNQISTEILEAKAIEEGMITMLQDGILKVLAGHTTLEEVYRVVG